MKLAELFVDFVVSGVQGVQQALASVQQGLSRVADGATAFGRIAEASMGRAVHAIEGYVRAGVAASAIGQTLAFEQEQLARTVGGLFTPELLKLRDLLRDVTEWIRGLSEEQKTMAARFIMGAAAVLAVTSVVPMLTGAVQALTGAFLAFNLSTGGILTFLGMALGAFAALGAGAQVLEGGLGKLFESLQPIFDALSEALQVLVKAFEPVLAVASKLFSAFAEVIAKLIKAFEPILEVVALVMEGIGEAILSIMPEITKTVEILAQAIQTVMEALKPVLPALMEAFAGIMQALAPLLPIIAELVAAFLEVLAPVLQIVAILLTAIMKILKPIIEVFVGFARIVVSILTPALKALAWVLEQIARFLAFITGTDLNKATKGALDFQKKKDEGRGTLAPKSTGFEALEAAWSRIAQQSVNVTAGVKPVDEQQLDELKKIREEQEKTRGAIERKPPAVKERN